MNGRNRAYAFAEHCVSDGDATVGAFEHLEKNLVLWVRRDEGEGDEGGGGSQGHSCLKPHLSLGGKWALGPREPLSQTYVSNHKPIYPHRFSYDCNLVKSWRCL